MNLEQTFQQLQKQKFLKDKENLIPFLIALGLNLFLSLYIFFVFRGSVGQISLHYDILFGVDSVGSWYRLFQMPLIGLIVLLLNLSLIFRFYLQRKLRLIRLLWVGAVGTQIFLVSALFFLLYYTF